VLPPNPSAPPKLIVEPPFDEVLPVAALPVEPVPTLKPSSGVELQPTTFTPRSVTAATKPVGTNQTREGKNFMR
jgi:hypothetical protein